MTDDAQNPIRVVLAANHRYVRGLEATLASMALYAREKNRLQFHVLADGLEPADEQAVIALGRRLGLVRPIDFLRPDMRPLVARFDAYRGSHAPFLRLFLCELLPYDWVVYSDVDVLWFRDVGELWKERDDSFSIGWCKDLPSLQKGSAAMHRKFNPAFDPSRYACSGVILMNLKRLRETGFVARCVDFVDKWGTPPFVDQDILNSLCQADARLLDPRWDCMNPDPRAPEGVVLHFNGLGPHFNEPFSGWRVHYAIWYRFLYDVVLEEPERPVCGAFKRLVFALAGLVYVPRAVAAFFTWPLDPMRTDNVHRTFFFAWLRLRLPRPPRGDEY